mgnify:CR=1 FL=1
MFNCTLVGQAFPDFTAAAVLGDGTIVDSFKLSDRIRGKYAVLFFYPLDFTFVCPTELVAFDEYKQEFDKKNVELIGISIDSEHTHAAWRNTPLNKGGVGSLSYPLVADISHEICQSYGVEHQEKRVAYRATCIIDHQGIIRHQSVNDLPIGRDPMEYLRLIDAIQHHEQYGEVCPAGWNKGKKAIEATQESVSAYLEQFIKES